MVNMNVGPCPTGQYTALCSSDTSAIQQAPNNGFLSGPVPLSVRGQVTKAKPRAYR